MNRSKSRKIRKSVGKSEQMTKLRNKEKKVPSWLALGGGNRRKRRRRLFVNGKADLGGVKNLASGLKIMAIESDLKGPKPSRVDRRQLGSSIKARKGHGRQSKAIARYGGLGRRGASQKPKKQLQLNIKSRRSQSMVKTNK